MTGGFPGKVEPIFTFISDYHSIPSYAKERSTRGILYIILIVTDVQHNKVNKYTKILLQQTEIISSFATTKMLKQGVHSVLGYHSKVEKAMIIILLQITHYDFSTGEDVRYKLHHFCF